MKHKVLKQAPLFIIILLTAIFLYYAVARKQGSVEIGQFTSPDGAYTVQVYKYPDLFGLDAEAGSGYAMLLDAEEIVWDSADIKDLSVLPPIWTATNVIFGEDEAILLPTPEELQKLAEDKQKAAEEKAAEEALKKAAEDRREGN